jgi:hypothetical protein
MRLGRENNCLAASQGISLMELILPAFVLGRTKELRLGYRSFGRVQTFEALNSGRVTGLPTQRTALMNWQRFAV